MLRLYDFVDPNGFGELLKAVTPGAARRRSERPRRKGAEGGTYPS